MTNLRVYALADKFNIPALMDLAVDKFKRHINIWPLHDFPAIVSEIVELTPVNDRGLRPGKLNEDLLVLLDLHIKRPLSHCLRAARNCLELSHLSQTDIFRCELVLLRTFLFIKSYRKST